MSDIFEGCPTANTEHHVVPEAINTQNTRVDGGYCLTLQWQVHVVTEQATPARSHCGAGDGRTAAHAPCRGRTGPDHHEHFSPAAAPPAAPGNTKWDTGCTLFAHNPTPRDFPCCEVLHACSRRRQSRRRRNDPASPRSLLVQVSVVDGTHVVDWVPFSCVWPWRYEVAAFLFQIL